MFQFQKSPPADPRGNSLPLMRTPTNKPIQGIVTSSEMVGTRTHYYRGRTIPCDDTDCPACTDGIPWRWHGYVSVYSPGSHKTVLFELTAKAAEPLTQYFAAYGTLRGCEIIAKRANMSPNSRVLLQTKPADLEKITLPAEPNLLEALSIIWNIELTAIAIDGTNKGNPSIAITEDRDLKLNRIRKTLNGSSPTHAGGNGKIR